MDSFLNFLNRCPTAFHAASELASSFTKAGFTPLREQDAWNLIPGEAYFVQRGDSLLAAFRLPNETPRRTAVLVSHLDSPCLKLKPSPEQSIRGMGLLLTETYGAPILHTWLDRDLYLAGRITVRSNSGTIVSRLVDLQEDPLIIPQVALHLDRQMNEKGLVVNKQEHLKPIFTLSVKERQIEERLRASFSFDSILSYDLFLVPKEQAAFIGLDKDLIASHRLDNLSSAYAAYQGLIHSKKQPETIQMAIFWDHEEIGSMTYQGADSAFSQDLFERICLGLHLSREEMLRLKSCSYCISADVAHGYHPLHADKYDSQNAPFLGLGPAIKWNANQKYATDSCFAAALRDLADGQNIPVQIFASRSDIPSGSTVGPFMSSRMGIRTADLGVACWAMHSARETIAREDQKHLELLLKAALEIPLTLNPLE